MKIAFLTPVSLNEWGGVEHWIFGISEQLAKKHQVAVISNGLTFKKRVNHLLPHSFSYYELPTFALTSLKPSFILPRLPRWVENFDIVYLYHVSYLYSYRVLSTIKIPVILGLHYNISPVSGFYLKRELTLKLFDMLLRLPAGISCPSQHQIDWIRKNLPNRGWKLFHNVSFIDVNTFKPNCNKRHFTVLYAGRLAKGKGIETIIAAICHTNKNIRWVFVGSGEKKYEDLVVKASKRLPNVIWKRFLMGKELSEEFSQASITVLPSESEGFSNVALQSLACGTPVILSEIPANFELASMSRFKAYSFFPYSKSEELIGEILQWKKLIETDESYYSEISTEASKFIRSKFSPHRAQQSFEHMLDQILEPK